MGRTPVNTLNRSVSSESLAVPEGQPWAHVDVYAWNDNDRPGKPFGGEAQGLRAAFEFLRGWK